MFEGDDKAIADEKSVMRLPSRTVNLFSDSDDDEDDIQILERAHGYPLGRKGVLIQSSHIPSGGGCPNVGRRMLAICDL